VKNRHLSLWFAVLVVCLSLMPSRAAAEPYLVSLNLLAGVGGSLDGEPSSGLGNGTLQVGLSFPTDVNTVVAVRVGRLSLNSRPVFEGLKDARLDYANIAGEYRFTESFYTSGLFLGLGAYRLSGDAPAGHTDSTQVGLVFGADGEFNINRRFAIAVELAGHYVNFNNTARIYATAHAGLAIHF
jgi:hypothetical protein